MPFKIGLTCELLANGAVRIESLGLIMADVGIGWCLDSSRHATGPVLLNGVLLRHIVKVRMEIGQSY